MSSASSLVDYLNAHHAGTDTVAHVCVDLVDSWSGGKDANDTYSELMENAKDYAAVDNMLYQLEGDPAYVDNAALIVISAAWNYPELAAEIKKLVLEAEISPKTLSASQEARAVLYGMYLMARDGARVDEVTFRNAQGEIETQTLSQDIAAATLFEAVRDQYGYTL